jgi:hypothetical protein
VYARVLELLAQLLVVHYEGGALVLQFQADFLLQQLLR